MNNLFNKIYKNNKESFYELLKENLIAEKKMFIITANPETFMIAEKEKSFENMLLDEETTMVPDGIGIVRGAKILGIDLAERIPRNRHSGEVIRIR